MTCRYPNHPAEQNMLPVFRPLACWLGALVSGVALAQGAAALPEVDESKLPEWVKRQARSPYKVIIDSSTVRARPAAASKEDNSARQAKKAALAAAPAAPLSASPSAPPAALRTAPTAAPADAPATPAPASSAPPEAAARGNDVRDAAGGSVRFAFTKL